METNTSPRGLSVNAAAHYSSLSRATLYRLHAAGRLPIRRIAGRSVILRDDIDRLLTGVPVVAALCEPGAN